MPPCFRFLSASCWCPRSRPRDPQWDAAHTWPDSKHSREHPLPCRFFKILLKSSSYYLTSFQIYLIYSNLFQRRGRSDKQHGDATRNGARRGWKGRQLRQERPRQVSIEKQVALKTRIDELLDKEVIRPSKAKVWTQVHLVRKLSGGPYSGVLPHASP